MARLDSFGMFWEDAPRERGAPARVMPPIPETGWKPLQPHEFPNLEKAVALAIDTETYDPELLTRGPGWARGVGHLVGVSVAAVDALGNRGKWYFPMRHEVQPELNLPVEAVLAWLRKELGRERQHKAGANILYDVGWLQQEDVYVKGRLHDVLFAEALLTESRRINLDSVAKRYLDTGKETDTLYEWLAAYYGGAATEKQRANLYRSPPTLAGPYAEEDAALPLELMDKLYPLLESQELTTVYDMECRLIPLTIAMRFKGVNVDIAAANTLRDSLKQEEDTEIAELSKLAGRQINVNSAADIAVLFEKQGIPFKRLPPTKKMLEQGVTQGNPSFNKQSLTAAKHPIAEKILNIRKLAKLRGTFIEGYILDSHINGRVYAQFHAMRGDSGGTRSGRWSSSNPNLQNIPARDKVWAPKLRGLFIPDDHHGFILAPDYSQIEYRNLAHFARGESGVKLREIYNSQASTDYHAITQRMVEAVLGLKIDRKPIKNLNFGLIYGMGVAALLELLGVDEKQGKAFIDAYHTAAPYVRETMDYYTKAAEDSGIVRTIMGRISHFNSWESKKRGKDALTLPKEQAEKLWGSDNIVRAGCYRALNRLLQGSAADELKLAMLKCWDAGLFDGDNVPRLTVHDELVFSKETGSITDEWSLAVQNEMINVMPEIRVPLAVDMDIGTNWGNVS